MLMYDTPSFVFLERDLQTRLMTRIRPFSESQGVRFTEGNHVRILECVEMHKKGKLQTKTVMQRVRKYLTKHPDLWLRFHRIVEPNAPRVQNAMTQIQSPFGKSLSMELFQQHVLPLLSYPCAGRLASVCKWTRECIGVDGLVNARLRFETRIPGRMEISGLKLCIWNIEDEPMVLHIISIDLHLLGLEYAGQTFVCRDMSIFDHVETRRGINSVDFNFTDIFQQLLRAEDVSDLRIWAKIVHIARTIRMEICVYGNLPPIMLKHNGADAVFKFVLEFYPSVNWGPNRE